MALLRLPRAQGQAATAQPPSRAHRQPRAALMHWTLPRLPPPRRCPLDPQRAAPRRAPHVPPPANRERLLQHQQPLRRHLVGVRRK